MHLSPKKKLGQNFLRDKNIQRKIISALRLRPTDAVLEIGAGDGALTRVIAQQVKRTYAVEIDPALCQRLRERLIGLSNVEVIQADILKLNLAKYGLAKKLKIVGNIPYYITSPIIAHIFNFKRRINVLYLTVQKEFAQRIVASPGAKAYGAFSCFVQYYASAKVLFYIKRTCFFPAPKVDSAFLELQIRRKPLLGKSQEEFLFKIIRTAFGQRRKTLRNSLYGIISTEALREFFQRQGIDENIRPEELSLGNFINLAKAKTGSDLFFSSKFKIGQK
jgi:16S rRNA (adenine1518-N6/adenine1519-N6)-dimethyltransferase